MRGLCYYCLRLRGELITNMHVPHPREKRDFCRI
jgi:hypothetical protein